MVESTGSDDIISVPPSPFSCAFLCTGSILGRLFSLRCQDDSSSRLLSHFLSSSQFQPESQNGVSLAVIGSLTHHGSREREREKTWWGRCSVLIGQAWVTCSLLELKGYQLPWTIGQKEVVAEGIVL